MQINSFKKNIAIALSLITFFALQGDVFAADTIPTQIPDLDEQIEVTVSPTFPEPNQAVTITLDAYGIDLDNSNITWTSNGKTLLQGNGQKVLNTNSGNLGQTTTIIATISAPNSKLIKKTITIVPQSVDLIWEAKTYTPPFYKGKAMYSPQEKIKFVAIPTGTAINSKNAIYKWSIDGEVLGDKSGFGKNMLNYTGDILAKPIEISVEASDGNDNIAKNTLPIAPTNPEVYFYEKSPLYGTLFNKELSTLFDLGTNQEGTMSVYPFFYGVDGREDGTLEYSWTINNSPIEVPVYQNDMTFRNIDNISGKSVAGVTVTNKDNFLEQVNKSTLINFQKADSAISF
ncbi:MAG: hypothetical protein V4509_04405 [Patescibacteria group bacterium]